MENKIFTRKELYDLVWSTPMLSLSKKYNISDVGLRKICIRLSIPLPKAGHWQKIQFGKKIKQTSLPIFTGKEQQITLEVRTKESIAMLGEPSPKKIKQAQIETDLNAKLTVPERLTNPDKLIIAARDYLDSKDRYLNNGLVIPNRDILNIKVSRKSISRALRFMDTIIKLLYARKHLIKLENDTTVVIINDQKIEMSMREKTRSLPKTQEWRRDDCEPTGQLIFKIHRWGKEWIDGKILIEQQVSAIIARLELDAEEMYKRELEWKKQREETARIEALKKEFEKRQMEDVANFRETLLKASRWHKAINLRSYINEVEARANADNNLSEELAHWLQRAHEQANWYDPFVCLSDELLNNIDKETLMPIKKPNYWQ